MQSNKLNAIIKRIDTGYSEYEWEGIKIFVRPLISIEESIELTDTVMQSCINPNNQMFMPELLDLMFRINVIRFYTDVELPGDLHEQHILVYGTSLYDDVIDVVNDGQIKSMAKCLDMFAERLSACCDNEVGDRA